MNVAETNLATAKTPAPIQKPGPAKESALLAEAANKPMEEVLQMLNASANGLTEAEAEERLAKYGPNEVAREKKHSCLHRLYLAPPNPLLFLLPILTTLS